MTVGVGLGAMVELLGLGEFLAALKRAEEQAGEASRDAVAQTAAMVEREAKANFSGSHRRGEPHVGGDKPNVVTGNLRRSIHADPIRRYSLAEYGTIIAPRAVYGRRVELGWPHSDGQRGHGVTRAFPYFTEPAAKARREFPRIAEERWARYLRSM